MHPPARLIAVICAALLPAACSDDEVTEIDVGPTGPPSIAFKDPLVTTGITTISYCEHRYNHPKIREMCEERTDECHLWVTTRDASCSEICAAGQGKCLSYYYQDPPDPSDPPDHQGLDPPDPSDHQGSSDSQDPQDYLEHNYSCSSSRTQGTCESTGHESGICVCSRPRGCGDGLPSGEAICVGADTRVPLLVETKELVLRPPGACGIYAQCGHLQLLANGALNNEGATTVIDLLVEKLANPYHDGSCHAGTQQTDVLQVEVVVVDDVGVEMAVDDNGELITEGEGHPIRDVRSLLTVPCDDLVTPDGSVSSSD